MMRKTVLLIILLSFVMLSGCGVSSGSLNDDLSSLLQGEERSNQGAQSDDLGNHDAGSTSSAPGTVTNTYIVDGYDFHEDRAWVKVNAESTDVFGSNVTIPLLTLIDTQGRILWQEEKYTPINRYDELGWEVRSDFNGGLTYLRKETIIEVGRSSDMEYAIINSDGVVTHHLGHDDYAIFGHGDGLFLVSEHITNVDTNEWIIGAIDKNGNIIVPLSSHYFDYHYNFSNFSSCTHRGDNVFEMRFWSGYDAAVLWDIEKQQFVDYFCPENLEDEYTAAHIRGADGLDYFVIVDSNGDRMFEPMAGLSSLSVWDSSYAVAVWEEVWPGVTETELFGEFVGSAVTVMDIRGNYIISVGVPWVYKDDVKKASVISGFIKLPLSSYDGGVAYINIMDGTTIGANDFSIAKHYEGEKYIPPQYTPHPTTPSPSPRATSTPGSQAVIELSYNGTPVSELLKHTKTQLLDAGSYLNESSSGDFMLYDGLWYAFDKAGVLMHFYSEDVSLFTYDSKQLDMDLSGLVDVFGLPAAQDWYHNGEGLVYQVDYAHSGYSFSFQFSNTEKAPVTIFVLP